MRLNSRQLLGLKTLFHLAALLPIVYLTLLVMTDNAGGDPAQYIIHFTGMGALNCLLAVLLVSPIAKAWRFSALMQTRRLLGLYVFFYACLHLFSFFAFDLLFAWDLLFQEVVKRPYILLGAFCFLVLFLLAITSFNALRRKMGKRWQQLHNSIYLLALAIPIHFYWSVKSEIIEPIIYILLFIGLLVWRRLKSAPKKAKPFRQTSRRV